LDELYEKGIIKHKLEDRGLRFGVQRPSDLSTVITDIEQKSEEMKEKLPGILSYISSLGISQNNTSEVLYYRGKKGLEQVTYNSTKAHGMLCIYEVSDTMDAFLDHDTSEKMRQKLVENNIFTKQLTNSKSIKEYTDVYEKVLNHWEVRYINPNKMKFRFEVMIYNDVYAMYSFENNDIFCVEIYNKNLATMQKELFDFVWGGARKMKIINSRGKAQVV